MEMLKVYKALADETRLRLVRLLLRGPLNVNEIMMILQMGQSRISRHLKILTEAGLVEYRRQGTWIYYQTSSEPAEPLISEVLVLLKRHEWPPKHTTEDLIRLEQVIEQRRAKTRMFFDSVAAVEKMHPCLNGDYCCQLALSLLPERCRVALDMGTGPGRLLPVLLERAERVIAVDDSRVMLDLARQSVGAQACRCDFRLGDLAHLPVADGEVDLAVACMVLHHVSHPAGALAEAFRALRPDGQLALVDLHQHDDESLRERLADLWLGFLPGEVEEWLRNLDFEIVSAEVVGELDAGKLITFTGRKP